MPAAKYIVDLSDEEREQLLGFITKKKSSARKLTRARVLLKADEGFSDEAVVRALNVGIATVGRVRQRFVQEGLESALNDKPRAPRKRKLTGKQEAHVIALACSQAPEGRARWTLRLLANKGHKRGQTPIPRPLFPPQIQPNNRWFKMNLDGEGIGWVNRKYIAQVLQPSTPPLDEREADVWTSPAQCASALAAGARMEKPANSVRLVTWNIRWFPKGCSPSESCEENATDLDWAACTVAWMQADVISLQEIAQ